MAVYTQHQAEIAGAAGLHARNRVLDHNRPLHRHAQPFGRLDIGVRVRFAGDLLDRRNIAVDLHFENVCQADRLQHSVAVLAGCDDGDALAAGFQIADQAGGAFEQHGPARAEQIVENRILAIAETAGRDRFLFVFRPTARQVDAAGAQESLHAVIARLAVDVIMIIAFDGEFLERNAAVPRPVPQEFVEHRFPGRGVEGRRVGDDAVQIEQPGVERQKIRLGKAHYDSLTGGMCYRNAVFAQFPGGCPVPKMFLASGICAIGANDKRENFMEDTLGLIADIGATNARFAMAGPSGVSSEMVLKCADYPTIVDAIEDYLARANPAERPSRASVAIAGPVTGDLFEMTNHIWSFSISKTREQLGMTRFNLMNDFKAVALAVPYLTDQQLRQVGTGRSVMQGPIGIIGPGTGLGVASLIWDGRYYIPVPGEGGHVTMPARTQREFDIFRTLRYKYRNVSAERVCSGKGLHNIYEALRILDGRGDLPDRTPEEISRAALAGECDVCMEALDKMIAFLGCIAGDLALTIGAFGGIYIAGGIVTQLGDFFDQSRFRQEFLNKGRFEEYLAPIPTYVIQHNFPAFIGLYNDLMREIYY